MNDEIFQTLTVEGDILLRKPFLDFCFEGVIKMGIADAIGESV
jgi:hypothetical protein